MPFSLDRVEAARRLSVSSRTVDRHIQAGRIRTKRIGKKTFLEEDDVESLRIALGKGEGDYVVITDIEETVEKIEPEIVTKSRSVSREKSADFATLYADARDIIAKKDQIIQDLSYRLGKSETELKNSIPLVEYKKTTFLLEGAKNKVDADAELLWSKVSFLEKEIEKRNSAILGLAILFVLVLAFSVVFFLYMKLSF